MKNSTKILLLFLLNTSLFADILAFNGARVAPTLLTEQVTNQDVSSMMQTFLSRCSLLVTRAASPMKGKSDFEDIKESIQACYDDPYRKMYAEQADVFFGRALVKMMLITLTEMNQLVGSIDTNKILKIDDATSSEGGDWESYELRINFLNAVLNKNILPILTNFGPTLFENAVLKRQAAQLIEQYKKDRGVFFGLLKDRIKFAQQMAKAGDAQYGSLYQRIYVPAMDLRNKLYPK